MKRQVPVLMITFQIPVHADVTVRQILDAIGEQLTDALETARREIVEETGGEFYPGPTTMEEAPPFV